jgi:hypothetical protein
MSFTRQYTTRSITQQIAAQNSSTTMNGSRRGSQLRTGLGRGRTLVLQTPTPPAGTPNLSGSNDEPPADDPTDGPNDPEDEEPQGGPPSDHGPPSGPPSDNEDDDAPNPDEPAEPANPVADAMRLLAQALSNNREPAKAKVREPDVFDGSNTKKLRTFLVQCQINFNDRPSAFRSERSKINFAISYLSGTALAWFEPVLLGKVVPLPLWYHDYGLFVRELERHFGPFDPEADAENALENLVMRDNQHIAKYSTEFYRLAAEVQWDDASLRRRFYKNLPARIKNEICRIGKPRTLHEMRDLAQSVDHRHWEREDEICQENSGKRNSPPNGGNNGNNSNNSGNSGKSPEKKKQKTTSSFNTQTSASNTTASKPAPPPDYANKLGKDGKLTAEERSRRILNKLCLFCGLASHNAANCPKSSSNASKTKAWSSNLDQKSDTPSDSKK